MRPTLICRSGRLTTKGTKGTKGTKAEKSPLCLFVFFAFFVVTFLPGYERFLEDHETIPYTAPRFHSQSTTEKYFVRI
jgi:hypothetical protein